MSIIQDKYECLFTRKHMEVISHSMDLFIQVKYGRVPVVADYVPQERMGHEEIQYLKDGLETIASAVSGKPYTPEIELTLEPCKEQRDRAISIQDEIKTKMESDSGIFIFSTKQLTSIMNALELFSRVSMGQLYYVLEVLPWNCMNPTEIDVCRNLLRNLSPLVTGLPRNAHFGIASPKCGEKAHIAWDIQQQLRHSKAWREEPQGGMWRRFDKPLQVSSEPLPVVKYDQ